jgi:catechol 2,3-dioxygenase-like lactoylglutathione lyase family enzyme
MVEITVSDWPASLRWYRDVLGLEVQLQVDAQRFALLQAGAGRIALKEGRARPGSVRVTFEVDDLPSWLERLARHGVAAEGAVKESAEGYRRAVVRDPDGQELCLFAWCSEG